MSDYSWAFKAIEQEAMRRARLSLPKNDVISIFGMSPAQIKIFIGFIEENAGVDPRTLTPVEILETLRDICRRD